MVLLYSHLLATMRHARRVFATDIPVRARKLQRCREVVFELCASLDREAGGSLASNLMSIYAYALTQLTDLEVRRDAARLDHLIELFESLHRAWQQVVTQAVAEV